MYIVTYFTYLSRCVTRIYPSCDFYVFFYTYLGDRLFRNCKIYLGTFAFNNILLVCLGDCFPFNAQFLRNVNAYT